MKVAFSSVVSCVALLAGLVAPSPALAKDSSTQIGLRLFAMGGGFPDKEFNTHLTSNGLEEFKGFTGVGLDATYPIFFATSVGFRAMNRYGRVTEPGAPSTPNNPYYASIQQSSIAAILRLHLISTSFLMVDTFAGAGLARTSVDVRSAGGEGGYERGLSKNPSDNPSGTTLLGASVGIGLFDVHLFAEVGKEMNEVDAFQRAGATSPSISRLDLSSNYFLVGLNFNGLPSFIKKK